MINGQIFVYFFLPRLLLQFFTFTLIISTTVHEINEAIFLDPRTHSALIQCPLDSTHSSDIQWYDVANHRYESDHGRYYRINGSQPFDREFICSAFAPSGIVTNTDKYRIKIRTYGKRKKPTHFHSIHVDHFRSSIECASCIHSQSDQYEHHCQLGR